MKNEQIKVLIKEAIEEDRKERHKQMSDAILESLMLGSIGGFVFILGLSIILSQGATFASGLELEAFAIFDIFLIYGLVKWNYEFNQAIKSLDEERKRLKID